MGQYVFGGYTDIPWGMINLHFRIIKYIDLGKVKRGAPGFKGKRKLTFPMIRNSDLPIFELVIVQRVV